MFRATLRRRQTCKGDRQVKALDVGDALSLPSPRNDRPPIAKPHFSILEDIGAEWHSIHSIVHSKSSAVNRTRSPICKRTALHGAALFTGARDLHDHIANIDNELEADLLRAEQEAQLAKKSSDL